MKSLIPDAIKIENLLDIYAINFARAISSLEPSNPDTKFHEPIIEEIRQTIVDALYLAAPYYVKNMIGELTYNPAGFFENYSVELDDENGEQIAYCEESRYIFDAVNAKPQNRLGIEKVLDSEEINELILDSAEGDELAMQEWQNSMQLIGILQKHNLIIPTKDNPHFYITTSLGNEVLINMCRYEDT